MSTPKTLPWANTNSHNQCSFKPCLSSTCLIGPKWAEIWVEKQWAGCLTVDRVEAGGGGGAFSVLLSIAGGLTGLTTVRPTHSSSLVQSTHSNCRVEVRTVSAESGRVSGGKTSAAAAALLSHSAVQVDQGSFCQYYCLIREEDHIKW